MGPSTSRAGSEDSEPLSCCFEVRPALPVPASTCGGSLPAAFIRCMGLAAALTHELGHRASPASRFALLTTWLAARGGSRPD